jgi:hypothetical protein
MLVKLVKPDILHETKIVKVLLQERLALGMCGAGGYRLYGPLCAVEPRPGAGGQLHGRAVPGRFPLGRLLHR